MSKKVLLVRATPNDLDINGYNVQQVGIGKTFVNKGYDYDFITFKRKAPRREFVFYERDGHRARCLELPRRRFFRWGVNTDICREDFLKDYDLIICQEYYQLQTYLMSRHCDRVAMYSGPYYNLFMPKCLSPLYDALLTKKIDRQIKRKFVKSVLAEEFLRGKGYTNLENVGVALDTSRFDGVEMKPETKKLVDFMQSNRCLLYVGALSDRKNYPFLLKTYEKALEQAPDLKLVMIGKSRVSALEKLIGRKDEDYAAKYDRQLPARVKDGIYHLERMENPQLKFIYPLAKAFLLPSKLEIFGMVLLEAMYFGAPVVSSRNGGSLTLFADGGCGQIVEAFDPEQWAKAIMKYLNDGEYARRMALEGQRRIAEDYTWDRIVDKFITAMR